MDKNQRPDPKSNITPHPTPNTENEKRLNQVPNSKNPKVPGNEAPYRFGATDDNGPTNDE